MHCISRVFAIILLETVFQTYAAGECHKVATNCVPEEKFAYEKYTCCALAANCARSMQQVCAISVQETVCQRKKLHITKSILAASMLQLVTVIYAATVRHRAYILVRVNNSNSKLTLSSDENRGRSPLRIKIISKGVITQQKKVS
jgi:hypothetical protein